MKLGRLTYVLFILRFYSLVVLFNLNNYEIIQILDKYLPQMNNMQSFIFNKIRTTIYNTLFEFDKKQNFAWYFRMQNCYWEICIHNRICIIKSFIYNLCVAFYIFCYFKNIFLFNTLFYFFFVLSKVLNNIVMVITRDRIVLYRMLYDGCHPMNNNNNYYHFLLPNALCSGPFFRLY